jgi:hypothetical protein
MDEHRNDDVLETQPCVLADPSQTWFGSYEWQKRECEADVAYAEGRYREFADAAELLAHLESIEAE